ncbi:MAG: hypothetical protein LBH16_12470 [Treponema sp.]|jgi:hypothetical protein|nr:hypothetical protein [Treponema sp.]
MNKNVLIVILLSVMVTLVSVSRVDAQAVESTQTVEPSSTPSGRLEEVRKLAIDFESPSYFPSDWEAAETTYKETGEMAKSTNDEIQKVETAQSDLAGIYEELFNKTIPLYAQAREDEIISARDNLIATGLAADFPEYLQKADEIALKALDQYEAGDYYTSRETAAEALSEYELLQLGATVYIMRQEIVDRGFIQYDPENFDTADEIADAALDYYDTEDKKATKESAEEALLRYGLILKNGWPIYAVDRRVSATAAREQALKKKVNVAVRDSFRKADNTFTQAEECLSTELYEDAALFYIDAETLFSVAEKETDEKRERAAEWLRLTTEKIEESVGTAIEAGKILKGGSK